MKHMDSVRLLTFLVVCGLVLPRWHIVASNGCIPQLWPTQLNAFESRMMKQIELLQQSVAIIQNKIDVQERMITIMQERNRNHLMSMESGVYFVNPTPSAHNAFEVYRDGSNNHGFGGNWTVFQKRFNGSVDFHQPWARYRDGFGDLRGEHWLGLEKLKRLLDTERHELLVVLEDSEGVIAYAHYNDFAIGNEDERYVLKSLGQYSGSAGDSFRRHVGSIFTTDDRNHGNACAVIYETGGWMLNDIGCYTMFLNGRYGEVIEWQEFRGFDASLKATKMMIRPFHNTISSSI